MTAYWETDMEGQEQAPRFLDQVGNVLRFHADPIHTEDSHSDQTK
jgi:hypothetical protein